MGGLSDALPSVLGFVFDFFWCLPFSLHSLVEIPEPGLVDGGWWPALPLLKVTPSLWCLVPCVPTKVFLSWLVLRLNFWRDKIITALEYGPFSCSEVLQRFPLILAIFYRKNSSKLIFRTL